MDRESINGMVLYVRAYRLFQDASGPSNTDGIINHITTYDLLTAETGVVLSRLVAFGRSVVGSDNSNDNSDEPGS